MNRESRSLGGQRRKEFNISGKRIDFSKVRRRQKRKETPL
jgi:hypothetical protein